MNPKISVIMGIYNCADTLPETIDSLLNQTYTNWNLIMCDDYSQDRTNAVAQNYKKQFPEKIILIKNDRNYGLNYTLNRCLEYADGEYIARMDGDDVSLPERFEKEAAFLDTHKEYAIVSTPMIYFDENGDFRKGKGGGEPSVFNMAKGTPFCHAPCMVRKEAFAAVGGYTESPARLRVEDWDLWIRMYKSGFKGYVLDEPLYKMRDDRNAYKRRKFRYRLNEVRVCAFAVRTLRLPKKYYIWMARPIVVGLLPNQLYDYLHRLKNRQ